jgi:dUTP pyrophosphatase
MTLDEIRSIGAKYSNDQGFVDFILSLIDFKDKQSLQNNFIDIKYTDDEFGAAASELGLIKRVYEDDAGIDLPTVLLERERNHGLTIFPDNRVMLHTGIKMAFPEGYWGLIIHRSSTEARHRLRIIEGVIDQYREEILVQAHNGNTYPITIKHGQRLGQLIIIKNTPFKARIVDKLRPSTRDCNGFGSSNNNWFIKPNSKD